MLDAMELHHDDRLAVLAFDDDLLAQLRRDGRRHRGSRQPAAAARGRSSAVALFKRQARRHVPRRACGRRATVDVRAVATLWQRRRPPQCGRLHDRPATGRRRRGRVWSRRWPRPRYADRGRRGREPIASRALSGSHGRRPAHRQALRTDVARRRRARCGACCGERGIGHTGTLDPAGHGPAAARPRPRDAPGVAAQRRRQDLRRHDPPRLRHRHRRRRAGEPLARSRRRSLPDRRRVRRGARRASGARSTSCRRPTRPRRSTGCAPTSWRARTQPVTLTPVRVTVRDARAGSAGDGATCDGARHGHGGVLRARAGPRPGRAGSAAARTWRRCGGPPAARFEVEEPCRSPRPSGQGPTVAGRLIGAGGGPARPAGRVRLTPGGFARVLHGNWVARARASGVTGRRRPAPAAARRSGSWRRAGGWWRWPARGRSFASGRGPRLTFDLCGHLLGRPL